MTRKPKRMRDFILWDSVATLIVILAILLISFFAAYLLGYVEF